MEPKLHTPLNFDYVNEIKSLSNTRRERSKSEVLAKCLEQYFLEDESFLNDWLMGTRSSEEGSVNWPSLQFIWKDHELHWLTVLADTPK